MKLKLRLTALLLAMSMVFALTACGSGAGSSTEGASTGESTPSEETTSASETPEGEPTEAVETSSEVVYGGTLTLLCSSTVSAYFAPDISDSASHILYLESLFAYDVNTDASEFAALGDYMSSEAIKGQLADTWEWNQEDGTITVNLRQDVYFQDKEPYNGRQLVADDVKWSYDRILGIGSGYSEPIQIEADWATRLTYIESIECPDDFTVVFHLTESGNNEVSYESFQTTFLKIGGHEWDDLTDEQKLSADYACGTGPYILTELISGVSVSYVKNENYYDTDDDGNPLPYIDAVNYVYIGDTSNIVAQFTSGTLDFIGSSAGLSDSEVAQLEASGYDYVTSSFVTGNPEMIALRSDCEPFKDERVRKALQLAIDLEAINTDYYGYDADSFTTPQLWNPILSDYLIDMDDTLAAEYEYNPELAAQLLEEAGYGDGLEFTVMISSANDQDLFTYINSAYFAPLGITMNLETMTSFIEAKTYGTTPTSEGETRSMAATNAGACSSVNAAVNQTVDGGWAASIWHGNEEYNTLLSSILTATTLDAQISAAQEANEIYLSSHWVTFLSGLQTNNEYISGRVHGYQVENRLVSGKTNTAILSHLWLDAE